MGEYFSLELGAKVLGKGVLETAVLAEELEAARVLNKNRFSHDLIFETVLENISGALLAILHKQVLEAFEDQDIPGAVRLKHALGAESSPVITHYALQTADEARKLYAHEEIFSLLEQAAAFVKGAGLHSQAARILTTLAWTMTLTGRINQSLEFHQKALTLYQNLGDTASLAQVHLQLSLLNRTLGNFSSSQHYAQMALDHYRPLGDQSNTARALWRLGEAYWWLRDFEQAWQCFVEAQDLGQQLGDVEIMVWVLKNLGQTAYFLGNAVEGLDFLQTSVKLAKTLNDKIALGWVHFDKARVHLAMRQYPEATQHHQAALELFEESGHVAGIRATRLELGQLAAIAGGVSAVKDIFMQSHKAVLESHENDVLFDMLIGDAVVLQQQNRKESAAELVLYILGEPQKDNPFAQVRAKQILEHLEQDLSPAKIARLKEKVKHLDKETILGLLETI
jgi:tetratricopeptide (TPR) repeat protein